ncbi:chloroperoxidase-like protein [Cubamyces sp. BRFM 1775]|nr:chloroperoxidase-like protein [Cubamyces sp. BRFM 1775]
MNVNESLLPFFGRCTLDAYTSDVIGIPSLFICTSFGGSVTASQLPCRLPSWLYALSSCAYSLVSPNKPIGRVVHGGGQWPQYIPPRQGDSRCSCPALNVMANHGLIPRDGKNIKFTELAAAIPRVYNLSSTFAFFLTSYAAFVLRRSYGTDQLDLADIDAHNCIEHDGSLTRVDTYDDQDQGKIAHELVDEVLRSGTGPSGNLTVPDLSRLLGKRRVEAKKRNPKFSLALVHKVFASANGSMLLTVFGGRVDDLKSILGEERLPEGWEPCVRHRMGLTILEFNFTAIPVELNIKEEVDGSVARAGRERYLQDKETKEKD